MDRTVRLLLTVLALLGGLSAVPAQARMSTIEGPEVERVEGSSKGGISAIIAAVAEIGAQAVQRRSDERRPRPKPPATTVVIPSIQYGDRARE